MMEWITGEDMINLTTLCGVNMTIVYRKCALLLSVSGSKAVFLMDEWIMQENIVIWSLERLGEGDSDASNFIGISKDEISHNKVLNGCLNVHNAWQES